MLGWLTINASELIKSMIATFAGAWLAFLTTRLLEAARRYRENVAAGNLALFAIKSQFNEFLLFRKGFYEDVVDDRRHPDAPIYLLARPSLHTYVGHTIDFKSLGFLLERAGHGKLFDALHLSQTSYQHLIKADEFRNNAVIELHRELAKLVITHPQNSPEENVNAVGPYIQAAAESAVIFLAKIARDDETVYKAAFSQLCSALEAELDNRWHRRFGNIRKALTLRFLDKEPIFIQMDEPQLLFRKETLPAMPPLILKALEEQDRRREEYIQKAAVMAGG